MPRHYAKKVDANQKPIVAGLRGVGASVALLHRAGDDIPDLLVGFRGVTYLLEAKNPDGKDKVSEGQERFIEDWRGGPVAVVRSLDEALRVIGVAA